MIKWTLSCITLSVLVLFFLFFSCTELLKFYEKLIIVIKNGFLFSFLFLFFLYATMTLVYVTIEICQKIQLISLFLMTGITFIMFFKIGFHSGQLRIPLRSSLRNIYVMLYSVFQNGMYCPSISIWKTAFQRTFITSYIWFLKVE